MRLVNQARACFLFPPAAAFLQSGGTLLGRRGPVPAVLQSAEMLRVLWADPAPTRLFKHTSPSLLCCPSPKPSVFGVFAHTVSCLSPTTDLETQHNSEPSFSWGGNREAKKLRLSPRTDRSQQKKVFAPGINLDAP